MESFSSEPTRSSACLRSARCGTKRAFEAALMRQTSETMAIEPAVSVKISFRHVHFLCPALVLITCFGAVCNPPSPPEPVAFLHHMSLFIPLHFGKDLLPSFMAHTYWGTLLPPQVKALSCSLPPTTPAAQGSSWHGSATGPQTSEISSASSSTTRRRKFFRLASVPSSSSLQAKCYWTDGSLNFTSYNYQ